MGHHSALLRKTLLTVVDRYWNRYPGVQCDIDSYIYMPLLEETNTIPTAKYVPGTELYRHARNIAEKFKLDDHCLFQTLMTKLVWNNDTCLWKVETDRNDNIHTKWVIPAQGPLHTPKFPGLSDIESFKGTSFHSCRWDYSCTGGSDEVPDLTKLADKRVAVVGTGATAVQIVPRVAEWAKELYVFQRTPSSVDERRNKPTDMEWAKSLTKGWQQERSDNFTSIICGVQMKEDLVNDGWTDAVRSTPGFFGTGSDETEDHAKKMELADFKKMEYIRKRVDRIVKDPKTAEGLKPWYQQFCKRPCFHDEYLQCFNKDSVHLVDTQGQGVEGVTEHGLKALGKEYELDVIIYATGFQFGGDFSESNGKIVGRNGQTLSEKWKDGLSTFHGWSVEGFPNLMILGPTQSAPNPNWTHSMVELATHMIYLIEECAKRGIKSLEPTAEAEEAWVREVVDKGQGRKKFLMECTPGYYNNEGTVSEKTLRAQPYSGGAIRFRDIIREWRSAGNFEGMIARK